MKKLLIANWKCFKTIEEGVAWVHAVGPHIPELSNIEVVVCPSFTALESVGRVVKENNYAISLGAQTLSSFEEGAYTGEVSAKMLSGMVSFALLGHSERRKNFSETDKDITLKVALCRKYNIEPIVLVRGEEDNIPENVTYFAWEPVNAIGSGSAIDAQVAGDTVVTLAKEQRALYGMYGGSVTPVNVNTYFQSSSLYGVVVGSASLDPVKFLEMLNALR